MSFYDWHEIGLPRKLKNEGYDNYRAYVFNMPQGCAYEGYTFAHPRKISAYAGPCTVLKLRENWIFNLKKEKEPGVLDEEADVVELPLREWLHIMSGAGCLLVDDDEAPYWLSLLNEPDAPAD